MQTEKIHYAAVRVRRRSSGKEITQAGVTVRRTSALLKAHDLITPSHTQHTQGD
jgi:hypothetical protein